MRRIRKLKLILLLTGALLLSACTSIVDANVQKDQTKENPVSQDVAKREITITAVGDIMTHFPQLWPHYNHDTNTYDFNNNYKYIKEIIRRSHISLCNLETSLGGGKATGYPLFNTPDEILKALKYANFNTIVLANNHMFDQGRDGMFRTLKLSRASGFDTVGTRYKNENQYTIRQIDDVRVGICAYVYESGTFANNKSINGLILPKDLEEHINSFHPDQIEKAKASMKEKIDGMKEDKVDIIIFYIHWGFEYNTKEASHQRELAKYLAEEEVDIVFGSHPHVIQPIEIIGDTVVFYSLGNFISNQREIYTDNRYTEDGMIGHVTLEIDEQKKVTLKEVKSIPTWVHMYYEPGTKYYEVIPVVPYMQKEIKIKKHLEKTYKNTLDILHIQNPKLDDNGIIIYRKEE